MTEEPPQQCPDCAHEKCYIKRGDRWMCKHCGRIWRPKDPTQK